MLNNFVLYKRYNNMAAGFGLDKVNNVRDIPIEKKKAILTIEKGKHHYSISSFFEVLFLKLVQSCSRVYCKFVNNLLKTTTVEPRYNDTPRDV